MSRENKVMLRALIAFGVAATLLFAGLLIGIINGSYPVGGKHEGSAGPAEVTVPDGWWSVVIWCGRAVFGLAIAFALVGAVVLAVYGIFFAGRDRATFRHRPPEEQVRLHEAAVALQHSIGVAPPVADELSTRSGRRRGRAATRASWRSRDWNRRN